MKPGASVCSNQFTPTGSSRTRGQFQATPSRLYSLAVLGFSSVLVLVAGAEPTIPGLHGNHGLSQAQIGQILVEELRCAACHDGLRSTSMKAAPDLARVASRIQPAFIERMIENPAEAHPGTTMPQLMSGESPQERKTTAKAITAFLSSLSDPGPERSEIVSAKAGKGRDLYHTIGCIACHSPRDKKDIDNKGAISLDHLSGKYTAPSLRTFLLNPLEARPSGRMPNMQLSPDEAGHLAAYLLRNPAAAPVRATADERLIRKGRERFKALNCSACHPLEGFSGNSSAPRTSAITPDRGCLNSATGPAPDFSLSADQRDAIRAFLATPENDNAAANDTIALELTRFNCLACHERDDRGGVAANLETFFHTTQEGLGNDAKIPPPLTLAGAKLRKEWMSQVLLEGRTVRPYMLTRMPQFGDAVSELPSLFAEADNMEPVELREPSRNERRVFRDEARKLIGDRGLNCVACHNFNGKDSPGFKGLDLMTTFQRLQPSWFVAYLKDPASFRPGTMMPNFWPGGKAVHTGILDGDAETQFRAIWHYFSLGHSAPDPSGIRTEPTALRVKNRARTYRGRNRTAGFRAIAVGLPGGLNYSFNAEYGTMVSIWRGDFVNVNWRGQAAGDFNPASRETVLAKDVSLTRLENESSAWPLRPIMTKENPTNPDPLYPKNRGYAFRGYAMDDMDVPTFLYAIGDIAVQDKTIAEEQGGNLRLARTFTFDSPRPTTLYFRAIAGQLQTISPTEFQLGKLRLFLKSGESIVRPSTETPEEKELLVKLSITRGESNFTVRYEFED